MASKSSSSRRSTGNRQAALRVREEEEAEQAARIAKEISRDAGGSNFSDNFSGQSDASSSSEERAFQDAGGSRSSLNYASQSGALSSSEVLASQDAGGSRSSLNYASQSGALSSSEERAFQDAGGSRSSLDGVSQSGASSFSEGNAKDVGADSKTAGSLGVSPGPTVFGVGAGITNTRTESDSLGDLKDTEGTQFTETTAIDDSSLKSSQGSDGSAGFASTDDSTPSSQDDLSLSRAFDSALSGLVNGAREAVSRAIGPGEADALALSGAAVSLEQIDSGSLSLAELQAVRSYGTAEQMAAADVALSQAVGQALQAMADGAVSEGQVAAWARGEGTQAEQQAAQLVEAQGSRSVTANQAFDEAVSKNLFLGESVEQEQAVSAALQTIANDGMTRDQMQAWARGEGATSAEQQAATLALDVTDPAYQQATGSLLVSGDGQVVTSGAGTAVALGSEQITVKDLANQVTAVTDAYAQELNALQTRDNLQQGQHLLDEYKNHIPANTAEVNPVANEVAEALRDLALLAKAEDVARLVQAAKAAESGDHSGVAALSDELAKELQKAENKLMAAVDVTREAQASLAPAIQSLYQGSPSSFTEAGRSDISESQSYSASQAMSTALPNQAGEPEASVRANYEGVAALAEDMLAHGDIRSRVEAMGALREASDSLTQPSERELSPQDQTDRQELAQAIARADVPDASALLDVIDVAQGLTPREFGEMAADTDADTRLNYAQQVLERADALQNQFSGDVAQEGVNALYAVSQALIEGDASRVESATETANLAVYALASEATRETFERLVPQLESLEAHKDVLDARVTETSSGTSMSLVQTEFDSVGQAVSQQSISQHESNTVSDASKASSELLASSYGAKGARDGDDGVEHEAAEMEMDSD